MRAERYIVREGSRGGERELVSFATPAEALERRDVYREAAGEGRAVVFDAIDTDAVDPPESGELDWCPACGKPELASRLAIGECAMPDEGRQETNL